MPLMRNASENAVLLHCFERIEAGEVRHVRECCAYEPRLVPVVVQAPPETPEANALVDALLPKEPAKKRPLRRRKKASRGDSDGN